MTSPGPIFPSSAPRAGLGVLAGEQDLFVTIAQLNGQIAKLRKINSALINRVERSNDYRGNSFSLFQTAIHLEKQVRDRTEELQQALHTLEKTDRDRSAATEEAETARTLLSEAIESLSEGFALFDARDRLVLFNSKFRSFFPDLADLIVPGIEFAFFLRSAVERQVVVVPEGEQAEWLERRLEQHLKRGDPVIQALSDGRWLQVSERLTKSGGTVCIYTDVTEIKKKETQRRKRELEKKSIQLTATLDHLVQGVSVFDQSHKLAYWNHRFISLMGLPRDMVLQGMHSTEILGSEFVRRAFPDTDLSADLMKWSESPNRMKPFRAEYRRHDDMVLEVRRNAMPDGGLISTYTDITDQRRAARLLEEAKENLERRVAERTAELTELNEQLRIAKATADKANLSKTKFLAAASHDLLQPLSAARLFVSALLDSDGSQDTSHFIDRVDTALESVDKLLKALFDISKLDSGAYLPEWSDFSVDGLLQALASEFVFLAENKDLVLRVVPSGAVIRSDMLLLRRILQNFVSNAIRYTSSGKVLLGCRRKAATLRIEVWDTGPGIPEEHRHLVFEEFQRFEQPGTGGDSGFGLGLAIAQRSARILSHPVDLRSTVGKGSVFAVEVPYGRIANLETTNLTPALHPNYGLREATIVLIENDEDNLEGMTALLTRWTCRVLQAHNAEEASALIEKSRIDPDLIVADYHLDDGLIGLDAITEVRRRCALPIPGIIVTADHSAAVQEATQNAGYELLQKPIKPAELRSLMSHLMA